MRFVLCILTTALWTGLFAQSDHQLQGKVVDHNQEPIPGAHVRLHELELLRVTGENGEFAFRKLTTGNYHLDISYLGFRSKRVEVKIPVDLSRPLEIQLLPSSLEIQEMVIEEELIRSSGASRSQDIEVVDMEQMEAAGISGVMDQLSEVPGVQMIKVGTGAAKPVVRGLGFNRVVTNVNGMKQEGQQWGGDHGLEIDQSSVERAEIVKGAASLLYGADALGGVINLQTLRSIPQERFSGRVNIGGETATASGKSDFKLKGRSKDLFYVVGGSYARYGDINVPADDFEYNSYVYPIYNNRLKNTASDQKAMQVSAGIVKSWGHVRVNASYFDQQIGFFPGAHGRPRFDLLFEDGNRHDIDKPYQTIRHYNVQVQSDVNLEKGWLEIDAGYQQNMRSEIEDPHQHKPGPEPDSDLALGLNLKTTGLNARYHLEKNSSVKNIVGFSGQWKENQSSGFEYFLPGFSEKGVGVFNFREQELNERITLNYGVRADMLNQSVASEFQPLYDQNDVYLKDTLVTSQLQKFNYNVTGAAGLVFHRERHVWKVNLGSGFRFPAIPELSANGFHHGTFRYETGEEQLQTERSISLDLTYQKLADQFSVKLSPYGTYFLGYIYLSPSGKFASKYYGGGQIYQYRQADAVHLGGELSGDLHFTESFHFLLTGEYTFGHNLETNRPLPFMPPASVSGKLEKTFRLKNTKTVVPAIKARYYFAQNRVERNEPKTPEAIVFDATTKVSLGRFSIQLALNNIFNSRYFYHLSRFRLLNLPEQGRNFAVSLQYKI